MAKKRNQKMLIILVLVVSIVSVSIGFAAFSSTLNISSSAKINPSSDNFVVKFSTNETSLVVEDVKPSDVTEGLTVSNAVIVNSAAPILKNLSAKFTAPDQFVEYTIYARNEGSYVAYLNNINFVGEKICVGESGTSESLVKAACDDIKVSVDIGGTIYEETTGISNHPLESGQGEKIVVRLSYVSGGDRADGNFSITFPDISLVYSTIDDPTMVHVPNKTNIVSLVSGSLDVPGSVVSIGGEQFYVIGQENGNVKLLAMYNLYVGNRVDEGLVITPLSNPTGIQHSSARGALGDRDFNYYFPFIGVTAFSDIDAVYSGSLVELYINNYQNYFDFFELDVFVRLITKEELEALGCEISSATCKNAPDWVYYTCYWTGYIDEDNRILFVNIFGDANKTSYSFDNTCGVRPVIEIPLSKFE